MILILESWWKIGTTNFISSWWQILCWLHFATLEVVYHCERYSGAALLIFNTTNSILGNVVSDMVVGPCIYSKLKLPPTLIFVFLRIFSVELLSANQEAWMYWKPFNFYSVSVFQNVTFEINGQNSEKDSKIHFL